MAPPGQDEILRNVRFFLIALLMFGIFEGFSGHHERFRSAPVPTSSWLNSEDAMAPLDTLHDRLVHCRELEYILLGDIRDLLEEPPNAETARWLIAVLDTLIETLPEDFELCSRDGYLNSIVEDCPNWEPMVEQLENQHFELYRRLIALRARLQLDCDYAAFAEILKGDLEAWILAFRDHRQHEQQLLMLATHLDEGGGG